MVKKELLTERQRKEIEEYLTEMPSAMPTYIRSLRKYCKEVDYEQMEKDMALMERLAKLAVKMGRKTLAATQLAGKMVIRRKKEKDLNATFKTRKK